MKPALIASFVVAVSAVALAQDAVKVAPTHYKVVLENAAVRVLRITYGPGEKSAMHQHPDSIVVPLVASKVRFTLPDGKTQDADMPNEVAQYTPAGVHSPANVGGNVDAVLVEFKTAAPGKATLPASRPGMEIKVLAEGPRAMAQRVTAAPTFAEAPGTTHEYDQVVIALGATDQMSLSIAGKPARSKWARGDAEFIGRGVAHEAKNTGGKPFDFVIISIK
jgi:quercetin dioxygenase-like cupin family protein